MPRNNYKSSRLQGKKLKPVTYEGELSFNQLKEDFMLYKKAQGIAPRTEEDYVYTFKSFSNFIDQDQLSIEMLERALLQFFHTRANKAPATFNIPFSNLNTLFNWSVREGRLPYNPLTALGLKKVKDEGEVRHLEDKIVHKLLKVIDVTTYTGLRDYCFIILTLDTGIRPSEGYGLKRQYVNFTTQEIEINREIAKTRVSRILPISSVVETTVRELIRYTPSDFGDLLFYTCEGNPMTTRAWNNRLEYYSKKIGYAVTPYSLRHTFAINYIRNGGDVFSLQRLMGHKDMTMTKRYVKLASTDVKKAHQRYSPLHNFVQRSTRIRKLSKLNE